MSLDIARERGFTGMRQEEIGIQVFLVVVKTDKVTIDQNRWLLPALCQVSLVRRYIKGQ